MRSATSRRLVAKLKLLVKADLEIRMEMQRCNRLCEKLYPAGFLWAQSLYAQLWLRPGLRCQSGPTHWGHIMPIPTPLIPWILWHPYLAPWIDNYLHRLSRIKVSGMREIRVLGKT